ncbi:hypothetical protein GJ496_010802 [Pomphorhynchus laevis]|nr:hypothetical protein GJ496_003083 [Pomphorhynchus laevis]KAI0988353.1 hypothetical protein GJ496_010802 [Pomphorhynchus laevis]
MSANCILTLKTISERLTNEILLENFDVLRRLYSDQLKTKEYTCCEWSWHFEIDPFYMAPLNGRCNRQHSNSDGESMRSCSPDDSYPTLRLSVHMNEATPLPSNHLMVFKAILIGSDGQSKVSDCICVKYDGWQSVGGNSIELCKSNETESYLYDKHLRIMVVIRHDWLVCRKTLAPYRISLDTDPASNRSNDSRLVPSQHQQVPSCECVDQSKADSYSSTLRQSMQTLFNLGLFSDFQIIAQSQIFRVHRCILAARSTYFRALMCGDYKDSITDKLEFADIDPPYMESLLNYIYADRFTLDDLKQTCVTYLKACVNVENILEMLELSLKYKLDELRCKCVLIIRENEALACALTFRECLRRYPDVVNELAGDDNFNSL